MATVSVLPIAALQPELMHGTFAFYPAIVGVKHNQWTLRQVTATEILVLNTKTAEEMWISRQLLGQIASVDDPVRIVGLLKRLEYKKGVALPHRRGVIEIPRLETRLDTMPRFRQRQPGIPASVVAIREESCTESRIRQVLRRTVAIALLACIAGMLVLRALRVFHR